MHIKEKAELAYRKVEAEKLQKEYNRLQLRYEYFKTIFGEDIKLVPSYETPNHFEIDGYKFDCYFHDDNVISYKLRPRDIPFGELLELDIIDLASLGEYFHKIKKIELKYAPKSKGKIAQFIFNMFDV